MNLLTKWILRNFLWIWFVLGTLCAAFLVWDEITNKKKVPNSLYDVAIFGFVAMGGAPAFVLAMWSYTYQKVRTKFGPPDKL